MSVDVATDDLHSTTQVGFSDCLPHQWADMQLNSYEYRVVEFHGWSSPSSSTVHLYRSCGERAGSGSRRLATTVRVTAADWDRGSHRLCKTCQKKATEDNVPSSAWWPTFDALAACLDFSHYEARLSADSYKRLPVSPWRVSDFHKDRAFEALSALRASVPQLAGLCDQLEETVAAVAAHPSTGEDLRIRADRRAVEALVLTYREYAGLTREEKPSVVFDILTASGPQSQQGAMFAWTLRRMLHLATDPRTWTAADIGAALRDSLTTTTSPDAFRSVYSIPEDCVERRPGETMTSWLERAWDVACMEQTKLLAQRWLDLVNDTVSDQGPLCDVVGSYEDLGHTSFGDAVLTDLGYEPVGGGNVRVRVPALLVGPLLGLAAGKCSVSVPGHSQVVADLAVKLLRSGSAVNGTFTAALRTAVDVVDG